MRGVRFTLRPGVCLAGAAGLVVLVSLGNWQMRRLAESEAWIAEMTRRLARATVPIDWALAAPEQLSYRRVEAKGSYDPAQSVLLEHQKRSGRAGVHVLTPLRIPGRERALLIDRGFVPAAEAERFLEQDHESGPVRVRGVFWAVEKRRLPEGESRRQLRWHRVDPAGIERQLPYPLEAGVLIREADGAGTPPLGGTPTPRPRVNHLHYAITWFASAFVLAAVVVGLQLTRESSPPAALARNGSH